MNRTEPSLSQGAAAFLALSCVGFISAGAGAQTAAPDQATELEGVTVSDTAIDDTYQVERQASPKATAPLVDTPRSVTIIPSQVLKDTFSTTLAEALRTVPGITMGAGEGGNPLGDRPFIRGFDSQASTYLDGVRDIGAQSREAFAIEQIEVTKGPDSVTGGRGSAGGSINLVSKLPTTERSAAAAGTLGNADYKRVTLDVNQPLGEQIGIRLAAMWHDQDVAGRDAIFQKRWGVAPSIKIGLTGATSLTAAYYHLHTNELPDTGIPYLYTAGNAPAGVSEIQPPKNYTTFGGRSVSVPRGAFYGLKNRDFRKTDVDNFTVRAQHDFAGGISVRNTTRYGRSEQKYIYTQPDDSQGNVYGTAAVNTTGASGTNFINGGYVWRRANTRYGYAKGLLNQTDLFGKVKTGPLEHSFAGTLEISRERAANGTYVSNAAAGTAIATGSTISPRCNLATVARYYCTTIDNPNANDPYVSYTSDTSTTPTPIVKSLPQTRALSKTTTKAASLFDTISIGEHFLINLGARYDDYHTEVSPGLAATATTARAYFTRDDEIWTYQAGLILKPTSTSSLYVSTSKAATPPGSFLAQGSEANALNTTSQISTDALKVETTKAYEVGAKAVLFGDALSLNAAVFQTDTRNARTTGEAGLIVFVGNRRIRGVEIGYNGAITPAWNIFGGYTYMDSEIRNAGLTATTVGTTTLYAPSVNNGKPFPNTPKHSFTTFTTYKLTDRFTLGGGAIYMGKVYGSFADVRTIANGQVVISRALARSVPSYWRFDANASFQISDAIGLQVNVNNLANKRYYDRAYTTHYASQAAGRTALLTLNVRI